MPERGLAARVTVVDDSEEFVDLIRDALDGEMGCSVTGLSAPDVNVDDVAATRPDLLIVDLRLGDVEQEVSGWELTLVARAHRDLRSVPIILCSADVRQLRERAAELEATVDVHVLIKPFALEELYGLVRKLLTP